MNNLSVDSFIGLHELFICPLSRVSLITAQVTDGIVSVVQLIKASDNI